MVAMVPSRYFVIEKGRHLRSSRDRVCVISVFFCAGRPAAMRSTVSHTSVHNNSIYSVVVRNSVTVKIISRLSVAR
jgi:hypothetical protein